MFTGIIEELGQIISTSSDEITIKCHKIIEDVKIGDSISVNGICLTVKSFSDDIFSANVSKETQKVTTIKTLKAGDSVNLERALTLNTRLGGHIVTGHIDTVGTVSKVSKLSEYNELTVTFPESFKKYFTKKGSISIDGISLTIADCGDDFVTIAIIPHTYNNTTLKHRKSGDFVNIEFDILAKYVEKNLNSRDNYNITTDFLAQNGFM